MPGNSVEGMLEARCFISSQGRSQERRGENEVGKQPHERDRSREREQSNQIHRPANARVACWHGCSVERLGAGTQHVEGLRVAVAGREKLLASLVFAQAFAKGHCLGGRGGFVEQRGVGNRQAGEVADQCLEIEQ